MVGELMELKRLRNYLDGSKNEKRSKKRIGILMLSPVAFEVFVLSGLKARTCWGPSKLGI